ncbi:hypothetical protein T439DRAFT_347710 [Meredithblackwellia eburnea MCA 4105]
MARLKDLPHNSLPLSFVLLPSLSSATFSSPLACLAVDLPWQQRHPTPQPLSGSSTPVELPLGPQAAIQVLRILDPEHREPFISLSRIFLACGLSPVEGLIQFALRQPAYDSSLGGLAPFIDIWVTLEEARRVAEELQIIDLLAAFLEWDTRSAWSIEDKEEGGLIHNWKIGSDRIEPAKYSTESMLSTTFSRIHLLPINTQVRTLTSPSLPSRVGFIAQTAHFSKASITSFPTSFPALHSRIVNWTILEYETFLDVQESYPTSPPTSPTEPNLTLLSLATTLLSLNHVLSLLSPDSIPQGEPLGSTLLLAGGKLRIQRSEVGTGMGAKPILALVDLVSRLVAFEWRKYEEEKVEEQTGISTRLVKKEKKSTNVKLAGLEDRIQQVETMLEKWQETREIEANGSSETVRDILGRLKLLELQQEGRNGQRRLNEVKPQAQPVKIRTQKQGSSLDILHGLLFSMLLALLVPYLQPYIAAYIKTC